MNGRESLWQSIEREPLTLRFPKEHAVRRGDPDYETWQGLLRSTREAVRDAVRFDITDVATYLFTDEDRTFNVYKDFPCMVPSFPVSWMEWVPNYETHTQAGERIVRVGNLIRGERDPDTGTWNLFTMNIIRTATSRKGELVSFHSFTIDDTGRLSPGDEGAASPVIDAEYEVSYLLPAFMAMSFMHCKNVRIVDQPDTRTRQQRRDDVRHGVERVQYRVLEIGPMTSIIDQHRTTATTGLKKALHICRGHFSEYSEDKPLFGKYSGRFWIPSHVRGSADEGRIIKDYKVVPGSTRKVN